MKIEISLLVLLFLSIVFVLTIYISKVYRKKKTTKQTGSVVEETVVEVSPQLDEIVVPDKKKNYDEENNSQVPDVPIVLPYEDTTQAFEQFICSYLEESDFYRENDAALLPDSEELSLFVKASDKRKIAVKCLWKPSCIKGRLEWGKSYQLVALRNYQNQTGIPVFIIAGIAGTPEKPETISVIPLNKVRSNALSQAQLQTYAVGEDNIIERELINLAPKSEIEKP